MRVLLLNWRDPRSPSAGGAELLTHEVAKRLAARGHQVTWFTSRPNGLRPNENIDGVEVVRRGSELTTRLHAPSFARSRSFDVVVEQINTLPYFAPLWSKAPVVLHINQLAREVWWYEAPRVVAPLGWASESVYLQAYRRTPVITISKSTTEDLRRLGIGSRIDVIPMAVNTEPIVELPPKRLEGRLVAVGRLTPSKRYEHAIEAVANLRASLPTATLTIVGSGRRHDALRQLASRLSVQDAVRLVGALDEVEKTSVLTEADILVGTSAREGWGLTVTEAALRGTPAVVYDVPGFRDSVTHERTGLLVPQDPASLAEGVRRLLADEQLYLRLRKGAYATASELSWERTAVAFEAALTASYVR